MPDEQELTEEIFHGTGYIESKKDIRDYKLNKKVYFNVQLPDIYSVGCSRIKDQKAVGSCVAHSVSEVLEKMNDENISYSTAWIYGYRPFNYYQGSGMITSDALKTIKNIGCIYNKDCPGNFELPNAKEYIHNNLNYYKQLANKDKILFYARLKSIEEIKQAIYTTNNPVIVCIKCNNNITLDENYIADIPTNPSGGHAVVCYGWNKSGLLIQNSWGKEWGFFGCFILPYEYPINEAWMISKNSNDITKPQGFAIRKFIVNIKSFFKNLFYRIFIQE